MRKGKATPETRENPKLTMVVKTRTPLEAFQLLRMGNPVDQALGFYAEQYKGKDLHLMDTIEKLHLLAHYREVVANHQTDYENQLTILKNLENERSKDNQPEQQKGGGEGVPK